MSRRIIIGLAATLCFSLSSFVHAKDDSATPSEPYRIQPGDVLTVSVWKEPDLQGDVLVRPDGGFTFPLAGEIAAEKMTLAQLQLVVASRLQKYLPDPAVTIALKQLGGNRIYVLGKVNRPGEFPFSKPLDVMQAIALAGGMTPFAAANEIRILHRLPSGAQGSVTFRYGDIERGEALSQNIILESGDTVVVP